MSKIICDICGTTYPDTAECCPICGYSKAEADALMSDELALDELLGEPTPREAPPAPKKKKEIFDFDEANGPKRDRTRKVTVETEEEEPEEEETVYEESGRSNTFAIVLLTILIVALLAAAGFLFVRFYLPGMKDTPDTSAPQTQEEIPVTTTAETELRIPCDSLVLVSGTASGDAELVSPGQKFLLNVIASPEDTTDVITYASADESIATVTADGQIVAVGEGETVIYISCGAYQIPCKVVCNFAEETTEETTEATEETEEAADETKDPDETEEPEETEATEETTKETERVLKDVTLKLKKTDIRLGVYLQFQLVLDCDLEQDEVEWSSEHPYIVKVDEKGNVTALKTGTTSVTAKYGDQTASCIIRCG